MPHTKIPPLPPQFPLFKSTGDTVYLLLLRHALLLPSFPQTRNTKFLQNNFEFRAIQEQFFETQN